MQEVLNLSHHEPAILSPFMSFEAIDAINYAKQDRVGWELLNDICKAVAQDVKIMGLDLLAVSTRGHETQVYLIVEQS